MTDLIRAIAFYALHVACFGVFAAAAYGLGRRLAGRLPFHSRWEEAAFSVALGLGSLGTVFFAAALFHAFGRAVVLAVLFGSIWIGRHPLRDAANGLRVAGARSPKPARALVLAGVAGPILSLLVGALYPPGGFDALMYHLPAAKAFASSHTLAAMPQLRYPVFPQLNELLWAAALLLCDDVLAQLVSGLFCLVVLAGLVGLSVRLASPVVAAWSCGLWLASPIIFHLAEWAYVEMGVAAFATLSFSALLAWRESREPRWLLVSGALCGFAAATKYTGLLFVVMLPAIVLLEAERGERLRGLARFALGATLTALPWYGRLAVMAGNPVWPFLPEVFGYRFWTRGDLASAIWSLRQEGWSRSLRGLAALPWNLVFRLPPGAGSLSPLVFGLLPIGAAFALLRGWGRWTVGVIAAYLVFWFSTTQQIRFLFPILPTVCFVAAYGCWEGARRLAKRPIDKHPLIAGFLGFGLLAAAQVFQSWHRAIASGPPPVSTAEREAYLTERFPMYPFYRRLNEERGRRYVVYAFHDEAMKYYCEGTHLGDWFGKGRYSDMDLRTGATLLRSLQALGADFLLVDSRAIPTALPNDEFFREHFTPAFERPGLVGFEVHADRLRAGEAHAPP